MSYLEILRAKRERATLLLAELERLDIEAKAEGDRLLLNPISRVPEDLRRRLREARNLVLAKLRERDSFGSRLGAHDAPYYVRLAGRLLTDYRQLLNDIDIDSVVCGSREFVEEADRWRKMREAKFCANSEWYEKFKPRLETMVGWGAHHRAVKNEKAYDQCYEFAYELLPDCRGGCICFPISAMENE
jgi:hypothetical protein